MQQKLLLDFKHKPIIKQQRHQYFSKKERRRSSSRDELSTFQRG
jgi:hypothetical protein